ncbi:hypothetical protein P8X24_04460 [Pyrococcus kukulkanii]|uniref:hypothetical protein n=1 Tax=Pyrococcus kukulkanii TaxID=1609559 RepID=UPI0035667B2C
MQIPNKKDLETAVAVRETMGKEAEVERKVPREYSWVDYLLVLGLLALLVLGAYFLTR